MSGSLVGGVRGSWVPPGFSQIQRPMMGSGCALGSLDAAGRKWTSVGTGLMLPLHGANGDQSTPQALLQPRLSSLSTVTSAEGFEVIQVLQHQPPPIVVDEVWLLL